MSEENVGNVEQEQEQVLETHTNDVEPDNKGSVDYDSHKKLLNQHKRNQARLKEQEEELKQFREAQQLKEQKKLEEQGEYTKILETYKQENARLLETIEADKAARMNQSKVKAFLGALPGELYNEQYISLANLDNIVIDPQTGEIDPLTVREVADSFIKEKPELIKKRAEATSAPAASKQAPQTIQATTLNPGKSMSALEQYVALKKIQESK